MSDERSEGGASDSTPDAADLAAAVGSVWFRRDQLPAFAPFPGITMQAVTGTRLMAIWVTLDPFFEVPSHRHPHEQLGIVLEGRLTLTIGDETRVLGPGEAYAIPPDLPHGATTAAEGCAVIDIFTPPRDDYRDGTASVVGTEPEPVDGTGGDT